MGLFILPILTLIFLIILIRSKLRITPGMVIMFTLFFIVIVVGAHFIILKPYENSKISKAEERGEIILTEWKVSSSPFETLSENEVKAHERLYKGTMLILSVDKEEDEAVLGGLEWRFRKWGVFKGDMISANEKEWVGALANTTPLVICVWLLILAVFAKFKVNSVLADQATEAIASS